MAPVATYLRLQNIIVFPYIVDWLLVTHSRRKACRDTCFTLSLLHDLGLMVNMQKSKMSPIKVIQYIGVCIDSIRARALLPLDKQQSLISLLHNFTHSALVLALLVQCVLGTMASMALVVQHVCLKMRFPQSWFLALCDPLRDSPLTLQRVTSKLASQLQW